MRRGVHAVWLMLLIALSAVDAPAQVARAQQIERAQQESDPYRISPLSCVDCIDSTRLFFGCDDQHCYNRSIYGAFGLLPQRSYRIVFSADDRACGQIAAALNWSLEQTDEALKAVWESSPTGAASTNTLFSHPIFLRWRRINGAAFGGYSGFPERWLIAPILNDGVRRLVTRDEFNVQLWRFTQRELDETDWSDNERYRQDRKDSSEPIERFTNFASDPDDGLMRFPNLPPQLRDQAVWKEAPRNDGEFEVAEIDGRYYAVFLTPKTDTVLVVDFSRLPGDDSCYLDSTFSHWLVDRSPRISIK